MTDPEHTDDDLLSAYLDNELPPQQADTVSARLAREPALMQRLEAMRAADDETRALFRNLDQTPMPDAVLELLDTGRAEAVDDNIVAFPARGMQRFFQLPVALAAGVALVAGFLANGLWQEANTPAGTGIYTAMVEPGTELFELLEKTPSGELLSFADGTRGTPVVTFENRHGDYCRQLRINSRSSTAHGVACRHSGAWQLEALAYGPASDSNAPYAQASRDVPGAITSTVDALARATDPLDSAEEKLLISKAWKKTAP